MTRPLNFLHLTTFYPPYSFGGDAVYLHRLCHRLGDAGHHVDVVHCVGCVPSAPSREAHRVPFPEHPRVRRHELRSGYGWLSPLLTQQTGRPFLKLKAIRQLLRERPYDVLHFHNTSLLGPHLLKIRPQNKEFVKLYTTHEHWLVCPTHVLWKYNRQRLRSPRVSALYVACAKAAHSCGVTREHCVGAASTSTNTSLPVGLRPKCTLNEDFRIRWTICRILSSRPTPIGNSQGLGPMPSLIS